MKATILIVCVCVSLAFGSEHYNINQSIDRILPMVNRFINSQGWSHVTLPDYGMNGSPVFLDVTLRNLTTIDRTGICEMWAEGETLLHLVLNLGLGDMKVDINNVPVIQTPMTLEMKGASAEVGVTIDSSGTYPANCTTKWEYVNITTLGEVTIHSKNELYDGKTAPAEMVTGLISYYNKYLNGDEECSVKNLDGKVNICDIQPAFANPLDILTGRF